MGWFQCDESEIKRLEIKQCFRKRVDYMVSKTVVLLFLRMQISTIPHQRSFIFWFLFIQPLTITDISLDRTWNTGNGGCIQMKYLHPHVNHFRDFWQFLQPFCSP